jgi:D-tyrosyl-tRNA(Tyr) deacylase
MRALIQRVTRASVTIDGQVAGAIDEGFLVFLGVGEGDTEAQAEKLWAKIFKMRIFPDDAGHATGFALSNVGGNALIISQFTLYADCKKGNRPSFAKTGNPARAEQLYGYFCELARRDLPHVQTGEFGADMKVELLNDGPFSIWLDTDEL